MVTCKICGDGGHPSVDCPLRLNGQASKLNDEYKSFLAELGVDAGPEGPGGPPANVGAIFGMQQQQPLQHGGVRALRADPAPRYSLLCGRVS